MKISYHLILMTTLIALCGSSYSPCRRKCGTRSMAGARRVITDITNAAGEIIATTVDAARRAAGGTRTFIRDRGTPIGERLYTRQGRSEDGRRLTLTARRVFQHNYHHNTNRATFVSRTGVYQPCSTCNTLQSAQTCGFSLVEVPEDGLVTDITFRRRAPKGEYKDMFDVGTPDMFPRED